MDRDEKSMVASWENYRQSRGDYLSVIALTAETAVPNISSTYGAPKLWRKE